MNFFLISFGKLFSHLSKFFNLGNGSTWPGHLALIVNPNFCKELLLKTSAKKIVIAGTNGKTTTGKLITTVLEKNKKKYTVNQAGANLLNGLASCLIKDSDFSGNLNKDYIIFESDEFALPEILDNIRPDYLICLNLFRDQLDRYGELNTIATRWKKSIIDLNKKTTLILNADDPLVSYLGEGFKNKIIYFGLNEKENLKEIKHGADSIYCPKCSSELEFKKVFFSHLGVWRCPNCQLKRPDIDLSKIPLYPAPGIYNKYNSLAAYSLLKSNGFETKDILDGFRNFIPAFGRQEKIKYKNHDVIIFLSKNPTSFNESLSTIKDLNGKNLLFVLNDRIPDGLDVSWIWDVGIERIIDKNFNITVSGDRCFDMGLRLKYADIFSHVEQNIKLAIDKTLGGLEKNEILYILPNYSAMLDVRKVLLGRKLL